MEGQAEEVAWRMSWGPGRCEVLSVGRVIDSSKSKPVSSGEEPDSNTAPGPGLSSLP